VETTLLAKARKDHLARLDQKRFDEAVATYTQAAQSLLASGRAVHRKSLTQECGMYAFAGSRRNGARLKALATVLARCATNSKQTNAGALKSSEPKAVPAVQQFMLELSSLRSTHALR
jgi:hypothetical protein